MDSNERTPVQYFFNINHKLAPLSANKFLFQMDFILKPLQQKENILFCMKSVSKYEKGFFYSYLYKYRKSFSFNSVSEDLST